MMRHDKSENINSVRKMTETLVQAELKRKKLRVYLAGPTVFKENQAEIFAHQKELLAKVNCIGISPMDQDLPFFRNDAETGNIIAAGNEKIMDRCEVILFDKTPFHNSPSMDDGTAFEVGYMSHKAKDDPEGVIIIGYYTEPVDTNFANRVSTVVYNNETYRDKFNTLRGKKDHNSIEEFQRSENIMIEHAIDKTGGKTFEQTKAETVDKLNKAIAETGGRDIDGFEKAVEQLRELWVQKQVNIQLNKISEAQKAKEAKKSEQATTAAQSTNATPSTVKAPEKPVDEVRPRRMSVSV